jgi:group I intron endonuclease
MGFIYTLTSPSRKQYIGQTTRPIEQRFDEHQKENSGCKAIAGAIKEYDWDNFITDYYECPDDELNKHETWLIRLMGTLAPGGYNLREGGGSRGKFSEETKQKMSESKTGTRHTEESKKKMSDANNGEKHPNYGKTRSEETKKKLSNAHMGKQLSKEHKNKLSESRTGEKNHNAKRVYQFDLDGIYIRWFGSCGEAAFHLGKKPTSNISLCASGKQKTAYKFRWSYTPTLD